MANYDRTKDSSEQVQFKKLLEEAVTKPGLISSAYSRFWRYSIGNQILALVQCEMRGIQPGPIATFPKWKELGRYVRKGEKAITLCMPITHKFVEKDIATGEQVERVCLFTSGLVKFIQKRIPYHARCGPAPTGC